MSTKSSRQPTPRLIRPVNRHTRALVHRQSYLRVMSAPLSTNTPCQCQKSKTAAVESTWANILHRRRIPVLSAGMARHVRPVVPYHIVSIPYLEIFDAQTFISECNHPTSRQRHRSGQKVPIRHPPLRYMHATPLVNNIFSVRSYKVIRLEHPRR